MSGKDRWVLLLSVAAALFLTWPGFVAPTSTSSPWVIDNVLRHLRQTTLASNVFYYPMLQANVLAGGILGYLSLRWFGNWDLVEVFAKLIDPFAFMPLAEGLSFLFGTGAIVACWLLGRRLLDRRAGLWAAWILALTPTFNRYMHEGVPDAAMTCLAAFAALFIVAFLQEPKTRNYVLAGLFIGLATAAKYNAAVLGGVAVAAFGWQWFRSGSRVHPLGRRLFLPLLAGTAAFAVTSFQTVLQPRPYLWHVLVYERDYKMLAYSGAVDPETFLPWLSHLAVIFDLEKGAALLFLVGLVWVLRRPSRAGFFLLLAAGLSLTYIGRWRMVHPRFYLYVYPALAALAGVAVVQLGDAWGRHRRSFGWIPHLAAAALLGWSAWFHGGHMWQKRLPDTRVLAEQWIEANVPSGATLAGPVTPEAYPALLSRRKVEDYLENGAIPGGIRDQVEKRIYEHPVYNLIPLHHRTPLQFPDEWPEAVRARYADSVYATRAARQDISLDRLREEGADFVVTSGYWTQSYLNRTAEDLPPYDPRSIHFDSIREFYAGLEEVAEARGREDLRLVKSFEAEEGRIVGPAIRIYALAAGSGATAGTEPPP